MAANPPPARTSASPPRRKNARAVALLAVVVAAVGAVAWFALRPPAGAAEKEAALKLARDGPAPEAAAALKAYLQRDPNDPEVLDALVGVLTRSGSLVTDVEPYLDRLCAARPSDPDVLRRRLDLRRRLADRDGALADGQRVLELDPTDQDTRLAVAVLAVEVGRYDLAERELAALMAARPGERAKLGTLLARAYYDAGDFPRAEAVLNEHAPDGTDFPPARVLRGVLDYEAGRFDRAEATLRGPAAADTDEGRFARYYLARTLVQLGRAAEAAPLFERLEAEQRANMAMNDAAQRPDDLPAQVRAARTALAVGRAEAARRQLEAAVAHLGQDRDALLTLAECYDKLGPPQAAADARKRAAEAAAEVIEPAYTRRVPCVA